MDEIRIELICPGCADRFLVDAGQQGKIAECPFCNGWVDVPEVGRAPNGFEREGFVSEMLKEEQARQWEESRRQFEVGAQQLEQVQRALDRRDRQDDRFDEILDRMAGVIGRWELLAERMGKVIEQDPRTDPA